MALDTMRRYLTPEDYDVQGELAPSTVQEKTAEALGVTPELALELGMKSTGPMAALDRAANAARIASIGPQMSEDEARARRGDARIAEKIGGDMTAETVRALGLRNAGGIAVPPSMATPLDFARPINIEGSAVGLEQTGRLLRSRLDLPETVPSLSMPSGVPAKTTDFASLQKLMSPGALKAPEAQPIPVANASRTADAIAPVTSALPSTGPQTPAGRPDSADKDGMVAPSSEGAGSDALGRLSIGQALTRALEGSGSIIAGRDLRSGAAGTLGDRMKQIEALRAKREEQGITDTRERANNRAQVDYLISRFPDRAEDLQKLYGVTGKPNFSQMLRVEEQVALDKARKATEEVKPGIALRGVEVKEEDAESKAKKREQDIALGWARLNAQSAAAAAKAAADIAEQGASTTKQRAVDEQLGRIEKIVKGAGYTPLIASLEQADQAIASLGAPPSVAAQMKHALPGGDRFLLPQEKAYFNSVDKLKQMEQLAISGKVVSVQEREEFVRQYGTNWYANPKAAADYINMLRQKTAKQIDYDLASVRASPAGQLAIDAYAKAGGITSALPVFKGATASAPVTGRPAKPTTAPAGKAVLWSLAEGKWKAVPAEKADAAVASGKYER